MSLHNEHSSAIFTHLIILGIDSIPQGTSYLIAFSYNFSFLDITLQDIEQGKLKPSIIEIHLPIQAEKANPPIYLTNLSLVSLYQV